VISPEDLPCEIVKRDEVTQEIKIPLGMPMKEAEKILIRETLKSAGGEKAAAAEILGIATRTIYRKLGREALTRKKS
jgi:two-component system response regulator HydG